MSDSFQIDDNRSIVVALRGLTGPPGDGSDFGTPHRLLTSDGPPVSGSGLEPLDGVSDPWRWSETAAGWVGPAYAVTWLTGDTVPVMTTLPAGAQFVELLVVVELNLFDALNNPWITGETVELISSLPSSNGPIVKSSDGSGVAFLIQGELFGAHTACPDPTLGITTMLGDVTVGDPYTWPESGFGVDGDVDWDQTNMTLAGPKTAGTWPSAHSIRGMDPAAFQDLTGGLLLEQPSDPVVPPLAIVAGTDPGSIYVGEGQVAFWFDATNGAAAVNFVGKTLDGTVVTATVPLT